MKKISNSGLNLIKFYEGLRLEAYVCPAGVLTIGYGSTGKHVTKGKKITEKEAEDLLRKDLVRFEDAVNKLVKVEIKQTQFDALVSFAFNLGEGNLQKSTLLKKINAKDFEGAAKEFLKWDKAGGKVLSGLTKRRKEEMELFLK